MEKEGFFLIYFVLFCLILNSLYEKNIMLRTAKCTVQSKRNFNRYKNKTAIKQQQNTNKTPTKQHQNSIKTEGGVALLFSSLVYNHLLHILISVHCTYTHWYSLSMSKRRICRKFFFSCFCAKLLYVGKLCRL